MPEITVEEKTPEEFEESGKNIVVFKTLEKALATVYSPNTKVDSYAENPWTAKDVDKFATKDVLKEYRKVVQDCRFFYRRDPIASSVLNKMVEISMTELKLEQGSVPNNIYRVYESVLLELQDFAEDCALEFLVSGLVIPEADFEPVKKRQLIRRGIKAYNNLQLPTNMWLRDPATISINSPMIGNWVSYFVDIPEELIFFIKHEGKYSDGTEDKELYDKIVDEFPELVAKIKNGETQFELEDPFVIRRKVLSDAPYPTPYLYPAVESLRHKRNLRRMDYSISARMISAIMHIKVGTDEFPLIAEDDMQLEVLQQQMRWRDSAGKDVERIFQLFTNHTVDISWIFPDTKVLLDEKKYISVNADILYALGMPGILITGEAGRSQSSDADIALISPERTMRVIRKKIIRVMREIIEDIREKNRFKSAPEIFFTPMRLVEFRAFLEGLQFLYNTGNISRDTVDREFGYVFDSEVKQRAKEQKTLKKLDVLEFHPQPHSNSPGAEKENGETKENNTKNE
jgi:hypothetical protein